MRSLALDVVRMLRSNQHITAAGLLVVGASEVCKEVHLLMLRSYTVLTCYSVRLAGCMELVTSLQVYVLQMLCM